MKTSGYKLIDFSAALVVFCGLVFFSQTASAQAKKKTTRKRPVPSKQTSVPQPVVVNEQYPTSQVVTGDSPFMPVDPEQRTETTTTEAVQAPMTFEEKIDDISRRLDELSARTAGAGAAKKNEYDEKQKRLALNLDILTKAEQRSESLRKQLFEIVEKENNLKTKIETIDYEIRPEVIERQVALSGSLRPEELREMKRKNLDAEKRNLQAMLTEVQATRANLEQTVQRADQLVEKLRFKLEKDIDQALADEQPQNR